MDGADADLQLQGGLADARAVGEQLFNLALLHDVDAGATAFLLGTSEAGFHAFRYHGAFESGEEARRKDPGVGVAAFVPLLFRQGEAYQLDWSRQDLEIAGKPMRVTVAHEQLCTSRAVYAATSSWCSTSLAICRSPARAAT